MRLPLARSPDRSRQAVLLAAALIAPAAPAAAGAQAVRVVAVNVATGAPAPNALVTAVDARDSAVTTAVTSATGARVLGVPRAGTYRVVVRRIGQRPFTSAPIAVGARDTVALTLRLPTAPVTLTAVRVARFASCVDDRRADSPEVAALWDQIRTAVRLVALQADDSAATAVQVRRFVAHLDPERGTVLTRTVLPAARGRVDLFSQGPSQASPGYVGRTDSTTTYAVPDGPTLLSSAFAREHCFDVVAGGDDAPGWIGLAFAPTPGRRAPDVAGVLWVDSTTAALRALEFHYVFPAMADVAGDAGRASGEAHFDTLPGGQWAMVGWRLRTPRLEVGAVALHTPTDDPIGGERGRGEVGRLSLARLAGSVRDGSATVRVRDADGQPAVGATVVLVQQRDIAADGIVVYGEGDRLRLEHAAAAGAVAATGPDGVAAIPALPPGRYLARLTPRATDGGGVEPPVVAVAVAPGARADLTISVPSIAALAARCPAAERGDTAATRLVYGTVVDERTGTSPGGVDAPPVRDARVTARWPGAAGDSAAGRQAATDRDGHFVLCGIPRRAHAVVTAEAGRRRALGRSEPVTPGAWTAAFARLALRSPSGAPAATAAGRFVLDLEGTVRDSVAAAPLAGAVVQLVDAARPSDTPLTAVTDAGGAFHLAAVQAGRYLVAFAHPALDGYDVPAEPAAVDLRPGAGTATIALAGPDPGRVRAAVCGSSTAGVVRVPGGGSGVVLGRVREPRDDAPAAGARVRLWWPGLGTGTQRTDSAEVATNSDGWYHACGLPSGARVTLGVLETDGRARVRDSVLLTAAGKEFGGVAVRNLTAARLPSPPAVVGARGESLGAGVVSGDVRDARGRAVAGARVRVAGGAETRTRADGTFKLRDVPVGRQLVEAAAIGHAPTRAVVRLRAGETTAVRLALGPPAAALAPVTVRGAELRANTEFARRMRAGFGRFLTAAELGARKPRRIADVLLTIPGLRVVGSDPAGNPLFEGRPGSQALGTRMGCPVAYYLDGFPVADASELDSFAPIPAVGGVEVYVDGSEAPMPYALTTCALVLVWTTEAVY